MCIISLINVYNHLHSEVSQICFEGGVAKTLYIPYKLILIGGVANQNNFATPPKYLRPLLTMQLKSRVKTNLRHFPTIYLLYRRCTTLMMTILTNKYNNANIYNIEHIIIIFDLFSAAWIPVVAGLGSVVILGIAVTVIYKKCDKACLRQMVSISCS